MGSARWARCAGGGERARRLVGSLDGGRWVGVGLMLGSWLVVLYALAGSLLWNWVLRPLEETDLETRFGAEFAAYRDRVACLVPRVPSRR